MTADTEGDITNRRHRLEPQTGDYWHDHFIPRMVVVEVTDTSVTICETTRATDRDHWTWDLSQTRILTREMFAHRPLYGSLPGGTDKTLRDKCWMKCFPEAHKWVAGHG